LTDPQAPRYAAAMERAFPNALHEKRLLDIVEALRPAQEVTAREMRILGALIDAMVADWEWQEWRVLGHVETAIARERPALTREGWNQTKTERVLIAYGWKNVADIYDAAGIPEDHRLVLSMDAEGHEDKAISKVLDIPLRTVQLWLHDGKESFAKFRRVYPLEIPSPIAVFSGIDEGSVATAPFAEGTQ
jgi:hypothetical protein